jgi:hypothetical protein
VIEAAFFGEIGQPTTTADCRRWSLYITSVVASSSCAREVRAGHRWKSFGRDSVRNVGNQPVMGDAYGYKGTVSTVVRSAD